VSLLELVKEDDLNQYRGRKEERKGRKGRKEGTGSVYKT
jgi:hypothetical protein